MFVWCAVMAFHKQDTFPASLENFSMHDARPAARSQSEAERFVVGGIRVVALGLDVRLHDMGRCRAAHREHQHAAGRSYRVLERLLFRGNVYRDLVLSP